MDAVNGLIRNVGVLRECERHNSKEIRAKFDDARVEEFGASFERYGFLGL
jgi:hypothetical protein